MKANNIIAQIILISIAGNAISQSDTFFVKFNETVPLWEHLVIDPLAQGHNINLPEKCILDGSSLYCLSLGTGLTNGDEYGYVLQALNFKNGNLLWSNESTWFNNDSTQEFVKNMYLRENGDIEFLGARRLGPLPINPGLEEMWIFQANSSLFRRAFDKVDGHAILNHLSNDTLQYYGPIAEQVSYFQDSIYLEFKDRFFMDSLSMLKFGLVVNQRDTQHNLIAGVAADTVYYETEDTLDYFSMEIFPRYMRLDTHKIAVVFHQDRGNMGYKAQFVIFDTRDLNEIKILKRTDITDIVPQSHNNSIIAFGNSTQNKQIVLEHDYRSFSTGAYVCFLTWLNMDGELISFFNEARKGNHYYRYIRFIHANEDRVIAAGFPSYKNSGRVGFDILEGRPGEDTLRYINSITTMAPEQEFPTIRVLELLEGDNLIVGGTVRRNVDQMQIRRQAFYCFDAMALGIDVTTSTTKPDVISEIRVYPNPFGDEIQIENLSSNELQRIEIYDTSAKRVMSQEWCGATTCTFTTSSLANRIYSFVLLDREGKMIQTIQGVKIGL